MSPWSNVGNIHDLMGQLKGKVSICAWDAEVGVRMDWRGEAQGVGEANTGQQHPQPGARMQGV